CASCNDGIDSAVLCGRQLHFQRYGSPGTRYFSTTQATPRCMIQSHTSVPSRSIARISKPPPGNTISALPFSFPAGGRYSVMVGVDTFLIETTGLPPIKCVPTFMDSGPGIGALPGGVPGHSGVCSCPAPGCQVSDCACANPHSASNHNAIVTRMFRLLGSRA